MRKLMCSKEWDRYMAAQAVRGKTVKNYCSTNALDLSSFYRQPATTEAQRQGFRRRVSNLRVGRSLSVCENLRLITLYQGEGYNSYS
jgi:hypothetical protein